MPTLRPVLYIIGALLCVLSIAMILPMLANMYVGHADWQNHGRAFFWL